MRISLLGEFLNRLKVAANMRHLKHGLDTVPLRIVFDRYPRDVPMAHQHLPQIVYAMLKMSLVTCPFVGVLVVVWVDGFSHHILL